MVVDRRIEPLLSRLNCYRYLLFAFLSKTNSDVNGEIIPPQAVSIAPVVATGTMPKRVPVKSVMPPPAWAPRATSVHKAKSTAVTVVG
jgi:hypothetical protein